MALVSGRSPITVIAFASELTSSPLSEWSGISKFLTAPPFVMAEISSMISPMMSPISKVTHPHLQLCPPSLIIPGSPWNRQTFSVIHSFVRSFVHSFVCSYLYLFYQHDLISIFTSFSFVSGLPDLYHSVSVHARNPGPQQGEPGQEASVCIQCPLALDMPGSLSFARLSIFTAITEEVSL